jgi:hypothetical protein
MTACDTERLATYDILKLDSARLPRPNAFIRIKVRSNKATREKYLRQIELAPAAFLVEVEYTRKIGSQAGSRRPHRPRFLAGVRSRTTAFLKARVGAYLGRFCTSRP